MKHVTTTPPPRCTHLRLRAVCGIVVVCVLLTGLGVRWWVQQHYTELDARLQHLSQKLSIEEQGSDQLRSRLAIDQGTIKGLEGQLQLAQQESARLTERLAFFEKLMPMGAVGNVAVRTLEIEQQGAVVQYRTIVQRNNSTGTAPFVGTLHFTAKGKQHGQPIDGLRLEVEHDSRQSDNAEGALESDDLTSIELNFDQFSRNVGWLSLPDGFELEAITAQVYDGQTRRAALTVEVPPQP